MAYDELVEAVAIKLWQAGGNEEVPETGINPTYLADARAIIPIVLENCAKVAEGHSYGDILLDSCGLRREHRGDIAHAIRNMEAGS